MLRHTLTNAEIGSLWQLVGTRALQLVWDLNAIYVVGPMATTKIEARSVQPESAEPHKFDEVFPIIVSVESSQRLFSNPPEEPYAYRVLGAGALIEGIEIVRVAIAFPSETERAASDILESEVGVNIIDCGIIIKTDAGSLVAFQEHPAFGFGTSPPQELLSPALVAAMLPFAYERVSIAVAA